MESGFRVVDGKVAERATAVHEIVEPHLWWQTFGEQLLRFAKYKVRRPEIAEELVQETFLSAWRSLRGFQGRSSFKTWLMTILKNKIVDYYEQADREREHLVEPAPAGTEAGESEHTFEGSIHATTETPELILERRQFVERIAREIDLLPEKMRRVFISRTIEEISSRAVCEQLKISESNLFVLIFRARARLRVCIDETC